MWTEGSHRFLGQLFDVAYGDGRYVIVGGRGSVFSSDDGVTWEEGVSGLSDVFFLRGIAYGHGLFIAVGDEYIVRGEFVPGEGYGTERPMNRSVIISSQNGVSWDVQYSGPSQTLIDIVYGDGLFAAIGDSEGPRDEWETPQVTTLWSSRATMAPTGQWPRWEASQCSARRAGSLTVRLSIRARG